VSPVPPSGPDFFYYETIKRDLNKRLIYECRCDARPKVKGERSTRFGYTVEWGTGTPKDKDENLD
jgi:hypothetical protein